MLIMVMTLCDLVKPPLTLQVVQYCVQLVSLWLLYTSIVVLEKLFALCIAFLYIVVDSESLVTLLRKLLYLTHT